LAGDTQATRDDIRYRIETKVWRLSSKDGPVLLGVCGNYGHALRVKEWIEGGGLDDAKPSIPDGELGISIVVIEGHAFTLETGLVHAPIRQPFFAIGSGAPYALAAMHCGKTAREAAEIACEYDIYSSCPITEVTLG
jgi:ATP-dependent protease HslVU (ClpYQ) peptidase subunit